MRILGFAFVVFAACGGGGGSEKSCETSAQCSTQAPYCSAEACVAACAGDMECPGFGQSAAEMFCVAGSCEACRVDMNDCAGVTPVCDAGECRRCERNDECASGACASDGTCVAETSIAYVSPNRLATAMCTKEDPCSLTRGIELSPPRQFVVLASGTHSLPASLTIPGTRTLIGSGTRPVITTTVTGPIIQLALGADVTFDHVELSAAKNSPTGLIDGFAVLCPDGNVTVRVKDSVFSQNAGAGIEGRKCTVEVFASTFTNNGNAISVVDTKAKVERSTFTGNQTALFLDAGLFVVTNNFIVKNQEGLDLFANLGTIVEHNTIADNTVFGLRCQAFGSPQTFGNNLFARNMVNTPPSTSCSYPNSISATTDIGPIKFKSPDAAPFDYHLTAGSSAVDLAGTTQLAVDFDGEARPAGAANDIGADELH
jgi:hypothetical protein